MRKISFLIAILAIVAALFATATPALAQSGFCSGSEPWIFDHQALDENTPPCGQGTYVLVQPWADGGPYNPTYKVSSDWASHVRFLKANGFTNGSFWFQPNVNAPVPQPTTAPAAYPTSIPAQPTAVANPPSVGFNCAVGSSNVAAGPAIATPPCPPSTVIYALDVEHNVTRYTDWGQAEENRANRVGTYWIEAWPQSQPPAAPTEAPTVAPTDGGFNWTSNLRLPCLGLLILAGAVALAIVLIRRRRHPAPEAPRPAGPRPPAPPPAQPPAGPAPTP